MLNFKLTKDEYSIIIFKFYTDKDKQVELKSLYDIILHFQNHDKLYICGKKIYDNNESYEELYISFEDMKLLSENNININPLNEVMGLSEAAKKWRLADGSSIRQSLKRGKFNPHEAKLSGKTWIITNKGMERVYGKAIEFNMKISLSQLIKEHIKFLAYSKQIKSNKNYMELLNKNESAIYLKNLQKEISKHLDNNNGILIKRDYYIPKIKEKIIDYADLINFYKILSNYGLVNSDILQLLDIDLNTHQ